ncbi:hypothetical protein [Streptosporangium carneum]|uniref:Uncharacterized protein n=1 Tax=Streptosporangium carneum TaxID=47481 RepID=A0A9W6HWH7_9ACTN|nr:hypothetical protein [Streptosporangium carneum]GLK06695.1 hypothetical protein GCM10017600_01000 [Streptosporangium carneum]
MNNQSFPPDESSRKNEDSFSFDNSVALIRKLENIGEAEPAYGLIRNLSYAHEITRDIIKALRRKAAQGVDINVGNDIKKSLRQALVSARNLDGGLRRVRKIIKSIDEQRDLGHIGSLADALSSVLDHVRRLDQVVAYTLGKLVTLHNDHNLRYNQNHFRDFGRLASLVKEITLTVIQAYDQSRKLEALYLELQQGDETVETDLIEIPSWVAISSPVRRLVDLTIWFLPKEQKARYTEEFRAEIWDLIAAKATRPVQVRYAVLQLSRAWQLRRGLSGGSKRPRNEAFRRAAHWILASNLRTWPVLIVTLLWVGADTYHDTDPRVAILVAVGSGAVFHIIIKNFRRHLRVEIRRRRKRVK